MYYQSNAGGWNRSHGQVERTPRIDSFELPMGTSLGIIRCGCEVLGDTPIEINTEGTTACIYPTSWGEGTMVKLSHKPNGYGGKPQTFFLCPQCGERVRYLYLKENLFLCRQCARLNYRSQQKTRDSTTDYCRSMKYVSKNLLPSPFFIDGFTFMDYQPEKPSGMWRKTYSKHLNKFSYYQNRYKRQLLMDITKLNLKANKGE